MIFCSRCVQALALLGNLVDKMSFEAVARLDPFPDSEPFTSLREKQQTACSHTGGVSLMDKIESFLSGKTKCLQSVSVDSLKSLRSSLQESQYEIEHALQQGRCPVSHPLPNTMDTLYIVEPPEYCEPSQ